MLEKCNFVHEKSLKSPWISFLKKCGNHDRIIDNWHRCDAGELVNWVVSYKNIFHIFSNESLYMYFVIYRLSTHDQWISIHVLFYLSIIIPESCLKTHSLTNIAGCPYSSCLMIIINKISTILVIEIRGIFMECWEHDSASISNSSWRLKLSAWSEHS